MKPFSFGEQVEGRELATALTTITIQRVALGGAAETGGGIEGAFSPRERLRP